MGREASKEATSMEGPVKGTHDEKGGQAVSDGLARVLSRDLRGPLSVINLGTAFLSELAPRVSPDALRVELEEIVEAIRANTLMCQGMVDALLGVAFEKQPGRVIEVDLNALVASLVDQRRVVLEKRGARVRVEGDLGNIRGTEVQLSQLFSSIIDGLLVENDSESPLVEVSRLEPGHPGEACFRITANGAGLPEPALRALNEGSSEPGVGGLNAVRRIAGFYAGTVTARNGGGVTVDFCLEPLGRIVEAGGGALRREGPLRALVVEDERGTAYMIARFLRKRFTLDVDIAVSLSEARDRLSSGRYDVVTIDQKLPDGRGVDLLEEMAAMGITCPAIALTGHGDEKTAARFFELGAIGYVVKDKDMTDELTRAMARALRGAPG